jgi:hypothetical protein
MKKNRNASRNLRKAKKLEAQKPLKADINPFSITKQTDKSSNA